ncbi:MAG: hypothetical protein AAFQ89_11670 [Cyanobacteria bacterium J06626_18]
MCRLSPLVCRLACVSFDRAVFLAAVHNRGREGVEARLLQADAALYEAKAKGRNRVEFCPLLPRLDRYNLCERYATPSNQGPLSLVPVRLSAHN